MTPENRQSAVRYNAVKQKRALAEFGLPGESLGAMIERVSTGLNLKETAQKLGISLIGLCKWRKASGIKPRPHGEYVRHPKSMESLAKSNAKRQEKAMRQLKRAMGENAVAEIEESLLMGKTIKRIARDADISLYTLTNWLETLQISKKAVLQRRYYLAKECNLLSCLKEKSQKLMHMYFEQGMTVEEIASALSEEGNVITHQGVSDNIMRSIRSLNTILMKQV